ncbi:hypothetical protein ABBQ32_010159 [Trebouxia sp. C0010 RCD-2024]
MHSSQTIRSVHSGGPRLTRPAKTNLLSTVVGARQTAKRQRHCLRPLARAGRASAVPRESAVRGMSQQMTDMRKSMAEDKQIGVLMAGLRGSNMDESDFADDSVVMQLVEVAHDDADQLPLDYDPQRIADFWGRRPVAVIRRALQLLGIGWGFVARLGWDLAWGKLSEHEVERARELREIVTSLGPAYIKLGQALSIRPDILSPAAMYEMQKLCDKVPSFDSKVAMTMIQQELGRPWQDVYSQLTPRPIAAASLGQVYRGRLHSGEEVAVKVQRPFVLETVTVDLFLVSKGARGEEEAAALARTALTLSPLHTVACDAWTCRKFAVFLRRFPSIRTDVVGLLDEWAARFFEELDYVREGNNGIIFAKQMAKDLPQIVVPRTFTEFTSRRVLTTSWLEGEKLSGSKAADVGDLVNLGVICYLKQLLDTGFFHADPHPGNLIRTPDGRLAILDFGLVTEIDDNIKFGMVEAISHLIHRDYEAIVEDFVTLQFIDPGTNLRPILPVLAKVFDQALAGGGAKNINFQDLAADLAQITFDFPFKIPPYFALIIRAISVLEGIALVGNPEFAIVDEAYPFVAKMLLTDETPRLRAALKYMVYGKDSVFDADRLIDLLAAFEDFSVAAKSARGDMDVGAPRPGASFKLPAEPGKTQSADFSDARSMSNGRASTSTGYSQTGGSMPGTGKFNARAGSRPYSSNSNGNGRASERGAYATADGGYGAVPSGYGGGEPYTASMNNMLQQTESARLAQFDRQAGSRHEANGMSSGNNIGFGTGSDSRVHSGQGRAAGSERAHSGKDASSSTGPWGSWGNWPPQNGSWAGAWGGGNALRRQMHSGSDRSQTPESAREALKFVFSAEGAFFRDFIMDELVRSIDAMSRSVGCTHCKQCSLVVCI